MTARKLLLVAIVATSQGAVFSQVLPPSGGKPRDEEEQIRRRREWFVLSRGLDTVSRPDRLRAQATREQELEGRQRLSALQRIGEIWEALGPFGQISFQA